MPFFNKKKAFTLAEILVVITVIGIISIETISPLLKNIDDSKNRAKAKAAYSLLSRGFIMMMADESIPDFSSNGDSHDVRNNFCEQMRCIKTGFANEFFAPYYYYYKNSSKGTDLSSNTNPAAVLSNGMFARFANEGDSCTKEYGSLKTVCGYAYLDTNGIEPPNMYGKDYLLFWIVKENNAYKIIPSGSYDGYQCQANAQNTYYSSGCTKYYIDGRILP